jgi:hypothetical protein
MTGARSRRSTPMLSNVSAPDRQLPPTFLAGPNVRTPRASGVTPEASATLPFEFLRSSDGGRGKFPHRHPQEATCTIYLAGLGHEPGP